MATVIPGQTTVDSVQAVIEVTPWWAERKTFRICFHCDGVMTMQPFVKDNTINGVEVFLELVVHLESLW